MVTRLALRTARSALLALALTTTACSHPPYVWIDDLTPTRAHDGYTIVAGDLLNVKVYNQEGTSVRVRVREDGRIAVPLVGEVEVRGKSPAAVSDELAKRLKEYVVSPFVTVLVEEPRANTVAVMGEVAHPGVYPLEHDAGVIQALAAAGGLTDYASHDSIFVVRRAAGLRVRFTMLGLGDGKSRASAFHLEAGDAVLVE
jgi:polysaccharide export outer membrane protein